MAEKSGGLVTRSAEVYVCPACREGVVGHFKYVFTEDLGSRSGAEPASVVQGKLEITGGVVPEHNCIPKVTRGGS